jgi:purine-nucleoside phosphorylase
MEVVGLSTVTAVEGASTGIDPSEVVAVAERTASRCGPLLAELVTKGAQR